MSPIFGIRVNVATTWIVSMIMLFVSDSVCLGQAIRPDELILEWLTGSKVNVYRIKEDGRLVSAASTDLAKGRLFLEFYDSYGLRRGLELVRDVRADQVLLIGNSAANLHLREFVEELTACKTIKTLILDSVDCDDQSLEIIRNEAPEIDVYFSERTAIRLLNSSYAFAQGGNSNASLRLKRLSPYQNLGSLEASLFEVGLDFIGRNWHPEYISVLPRDAIKFFRHMRHLESVALSGVELVDDDLVSLANIQKLKELFLNETALTGEGLKLFPGDNLEMLDLARTPLLRSIPFERYPKLKRLRIAQTGGGFTVLQGIQHCDRIWELDAEGVPCDTAELQELLENTPSLKWLNIGDVNESDGGPTLKVLLEKFSMVEILHGRQGSDSAEANSSMFSVSEE